MRKLLAAVLLTFRWLLVLLLPVLGLVAGLWLMPTTQARWDVDLKFREECAGVVTLDGSRCLVLYRERKLPNGQTVDEIVGLDLAAGQPMFTRTLPDHPPMVTIQVLLGTTLVMYCYKTDPSVPLRLYDWDKQQEVFRCQMAEEYFWMRSASYYNHIFAADLSYTRRHTFHFWDNTHQPPRETSVPLPMNSSSSDFQFSPNGAWAVIHYGTFLGAGLNESHVQLIDARQGKVVQELPSEITCIRWHSEGEAFLALQRDPVSHSLSWQQYLRQGDQFVPQGKATPTMASTVSSQSPSPFIVLASTNQKDTVRVKLQELINPLGELMIDALDRLWPVATTFHLVRLNDGQLAHHVTMPSVKFDEIQWYYAYPDEQGNGLVIHHLGKLTYKDFYPAARWYPRLGLVVGVILAIVLAWLNLRRSGKRAAVSHVMGE